MIKRMMTGTEFDIDKFDGKNDFRLWQIEDVLATLNSRKLQKMTKAKGNDGEGLADGYDYADVMMATGVEELLDLIMDSMGNAVYGGQVSLSTDEGLVKFRVGQRQSGLSKVLWVEDTTMSTYLVNKWVIKLWRLDNVTSKVVLYRNTGFNESGEYKKTFIGSGVGTGSVQVLQGVEFEVEPQEDHKFMVEPHGNVDHVVGSQKVIFKCKVGLKDDMDARSDVYVLSNGCDMVFFADASMRSGLPSLLDKAKGNVLGMEIVKDRSGNTLRVSRSRFYNGKLVQTLLEGHFILSLEGSLSRDYDVEKNGKWSCIYVVGSQEYLMVCTRLDIASEDVGMLDKFDRGLQTEIQVFVDFDYVIGRSICVMGAAKEAIWLKILTIESRFELKIVAGITTRAMSKAIPGPRFQHRLNLLSNFPTVFCLKINHGGAFTPHPKIRYKDGKVNWVDTIDSDVFFVVEVNNMMKELGYEKPSFDYYYKEPKNDLDNGLKKLSSDQDVLQMLKYVEKYKVIDLYVDHSVTKETVNVDESLLVNELDNDLFIGNEMLGDNDEDVIEDVSEDEWNESMNVEDDRDDGSNSDDGSVSNDDSDSQDNDFLDDPDNMIDDVDVDMVEFRSNIDANVEWVRSKAIVTMEEEEEFEKEEVNHDELDSGSDSEYEGERKKDLKMYHKMNKANASNAEIGGTTWKENFYVGLKFSNSKEIKEIVTRVAVEQRKELHLKKNDKVRVRCICRGKVPQLGCEDGDDDSGSKGVVSSGSKGKGQSKEKGQSGVENLIPIPSESDGGIDDNILLTIKDDVLREKLLNVNLFISKIEALNANPTPSSDCKTKSFSTSLNSLLEETNTFDNSLPEFETFCFDVEEISSDSTNTPPDISLPEYEVFHDDPVKEISSGSPTTHSDSSLYASFIFDLSINPFPPADRSDSYEFNDALIPFIYAPEYDCFLFKVEPNSRDFTKDAVENISPTKEPQVLNTLPTHSTLLLNMKFQPSSEYLFAYVVWIFLHFLVYLVAPYYLLSLRTEDIIFDPGICKATFSRPDISHRCGFVKKFNTHRSHLNKCPMLIHG
nr:hypothetical protein [Tanacetum cinerariifolium]